MSKLKWFIIGAMMVTVMAVLVGCGARMTLKAGVILVQEIITRVQ